MAEGIFRKLVQDNKSSLNFSSFEIASCGVSGEHEDEGADDRAISTMRSMGGIDITSHRARKVRRHDLTHFDYIFAMDESNYQALQRFQQREGIQGNVKLLLREFGDGTTESVPDPWYGGMDGFKKVYNMLTASLTRFLNTLKKPEAEAAEEKTE